LLNLLLKKSRRPTGGTNHGLFLVLVGSSFTSAAEKKISRRPAGGTNLRLFLVSVLNFAQSAAAKKISPPYGRHKSWIISSFSREVLSHLLLKKKYRAALRASVVDPDPVGSGPFWSDPDPEFLFQTGSGSGSGSGSDLFFHTTVDLK